MGDTKRTTVSLPREKYEELRERLDTFNTDTARFQHLVELFLNGQLDSSATDDCPEADPESAARSDGAEGDD